MKSVTNTYPIGLLKYRRRSRLTSAATTARCRLALLKPGTPGASPEARTLSGTPASVNRQGPGCGRACPAQLEESFLQASRSAQLGNGAIERESPFVHDHDPISNGFDVVEQVRREQHRLLPLQ